MSALVLYLHKKRVPKSQSTLEILPEGIVQKTVSSTHTHTERQWLYELHIQTTG